MGCDEGLVSRWLERLRRRWWRRLGFGGGFDERKGFWRGGEGKGLDGGCVWRRLLDLERKVKMEGKGF